MGAAVCLPAVVVVAVVVAVAFLIAGSARSTPRKVARDTKGAHGPRHGRAGLGMACGFGSGSVPVAVFAIGFMLQLTHKSRNYVNRIKVT